MIDGQEANPIYQYENQIKQTYPLLNGITCWKDSQGKWVYHFDSIPEQQQLEVLAYARTLGEIP